MQSPCDQSAGEPCGQNTIARQALRALRLRTREPLELWPFNFYIIYVFDSKSLGERQIIFQQMTQGSCAEFTKCKHTLGIVI